MKRINRERCGYHRILQFPDHLFRTSQFFLAPQVAVGLYQLARGG